MVLLPIYLLLHGGSSTIELEYATFYQPHAVVYNIYRWCVCMWGSTRVNILMIYTWNSDLWKSQCLQKFQYEVTHMSDSDNSYVIHVDLFCTQMLLIQWTSLWFIRPLLISFNFHSEGWLQCHFAWWQLFIFSCFSLYLSNKYLIMSLFIFLIEL